ncbi:hypothetical protein QBC44DRAFT_350636 [Cladorrhinum sp. PSN332]|nr:hypothetical protein QBC44DRAFT_350636 [Cladorrhinum sp. PSN332]
MCCAWMEVLPSLLGTSHEYFLSPAIKALGISIVARGNNGRAPIPNALEARCAAMRTLRGAVGRENDSSFNALAASMMCLFLSEMLLPTSSISCAIHAEGVATLIQRHPPAFYASGPAHKLFVLGFRPILILHSFITRRPSFLAADSWKTEPFGHVAPTPLQALMNDLSVVPATLEELDACKLMPANRSSAVVEKSLITLVEVVNKLTQSYHSTSASRSLWWYVPRAGNKVSVWFPDLSLACYQTNYWAFWIICVLNIRQLREDYPDLRGKEVQLNGHAPESQNISEQLIELSIRILQSIEFHIQDEMKVYGVISAAIPFQTAFYLLKKSDGSDGLCSGTYNQVLSKIAQKGYQDMLINEDHPFRYPELAA